MTKFYYDCPIKAAYMAKYFGMKFDLCPDQVHYQGQYDEQQKHVQGWQYDWVLPINFVLVSEVKDIDSSWTNVVWSKRRYVIHPTSLYLLKTQDGDLLAGVNNMVGMFYTISQRNGQPFIMPMIEG